ncbi:hypothetical protein EON82_09675, partial [bacterium]
MARQPRYGELYPDPLDPNWPEWFEEKVRFMEAIFTPPTFKELEWVVEGLIPRGYLTLLAGRPKDGKTCLATALGVA